MRMTRSSGWARWFGVLRLSRRQLQQRWLESMLIVLGLALGVGVLTTGQTFVRFQQSMTTDLLAGLVREWEAVTVRPMSAGVGATLFGTDAVPAVRVSLDELEQPVRFTLGDVLAMRSDVPGVAGVTLREGNIGSELVAIDAGEPTFTSDRGFPGLRLELVTPDEFGALGYEFLAGRAFTWDDFVAGERRIVLERRSLELLFPDMSSVEAVGRTLTTRAMSPEQEGDRWVIVGVVEILDDRGFLLGSGIGAAEDNSIYGYAPATAAAARRPVASAGVFEQTFSLIYLSPVDDGLIPEIVTEAQVYFDQKYGPGRVQLRNPEAERAASMEGTGPIVIALLVLAGLGLVIAAVNVLNLFTARVLRRMRITGMSVALGATRRLLFWQTAGEALLLGGLGSVVGLGLANAFVTVIRGVLQAQSQGELPPGLDLFGGLRVGLPDVAVGIVAGVGLSLIFGLYPAWLGSRQDPVEALRVE